MKTFRSTFKQLPALLMLLLFCGGWAAVPLRLALPEPVECTKTCCLDSGECCCLLAAEHAHEGEPAPPQFTRLRNECAQFASDTFSTKLPTFNLRLAVKPVPRMHESPLPRFGFVTPDILSLLLACEKSPRAPPQPPSLG